MSESVWPAHSIAGKKNSATTRHFSRWYYRKLYGYPLLWNVDYFKASLAIHQVPSRARLRQRLDENADVWLPIIYQSNIDFLGQAQVPMTPLATGHVALDIDTYPMNNEKTCNEGVSRTYKGFDGYALIAHYLESNQQISGSVESIWRFRYKFSHRFPIFYVQGCMAALSSQAKLHWLRAKKILCRINRFMSRKWCWSRRTRCWHA